MTSSGALNDRRAGPWTNEQLLGVRETVGIGPLGSTERGRRLGGEKVEDCGRPAGKYYLVARSSRTVRLAVL